MLVWFMNSLEFALYGGMICMCRLYYVVLRVGKLAKAYFLDMDTGSELTWLQCDAPCRNCGNVRTVIQSLVSMPDVSCPILVVPDVRIRFEIKDSDLCGVHGSIAYGTN